MRDETWVFSLGISAHSTVFVVVCIAFAFCISTC
jgi:hypothetical protein